MNDDQPAFGPAATLHAAITTLSVSIGRLEERLLAMDRALTFHTREEHAEFRETRDLVADIKIKVDALVELDARLTEVEETQDKQSGAWWALAKVAGVIAFVVTFIGVVHNVLAGKG